MKGNNLQMKHGEVVAEILKQRGRLWSRSVSCVASEVPLAEAFLICVAHVEAAGSKLLLEKKKKIKKLGCGVGEWCSQCKQMW